jgi:hypothetical protein
MEMCKKTSFVIRTIVSKDLGKKLLAVKNYVAKLSGQPSYLSHCCIQLICVFIFRHLFTDLNVAIPLCLFLTI